MARNDVTIRILGDPSNAQRAFGQVENSAGGFGSKMAGFGKMAAAGFAVAGTAVAAFGAKALMAASDLNETLSKTQIVFGEATKQVTGFANDMAKKFGLPKTQILDAASSIGLIGKASGLAQGDAAKMSTQLAGLAADASSFYNVPLEEALMAIQSGLVGEAEPMRRFGVLLNEAAVKAEAVALGLAKQGAELTEGQKAQARASLIMKGMADASGDLERTQGSLSNRLRELKGRAANFSAEIGSKLLPLALKAMDLFEKWAPIIQRKLTPAFERMATFVTAKVVPAFQRVAAFVKDNLAPILALFAGAVLAKLGVQLFSVGKKVLAFVRSFATMQGAIAALGGPVTLIVLGVAALAAAAVYAYKHFEGFRNVVDGVVRFLRETVLPALVMVGQYLITQFGRAVEWVKKMWPQISEAVSHVMNVVEGVVRKVLGFLQGLWRIVGDDILNIASRAFNAIKGVIQGVMQVIRGVIQTVLAIINGDWGKAWNGIKGILAGVWNAIFAVIAGALGVVKSILGAGLGVIGGIWSAAWDGMKGAFGAVWDGIKSIAIRAVNFMTQNVINPLIDALNRVIDGFNKIPGVPDIPNLGRLGRISTGQTSSDSRQARGGVINAMAHGGMGTVDSPTLFLAGEAGKEDYAFGPHSKGGLGGVGQTVTNYVTINMPPGSDGQDVVDAITRWERRNGTLYARA